MRIASLVAELQREDLRRLENIRKSQICNCWALAVKNYAETDIKVFCTCTCPFRFPKINRRGL